MKKKYCPFVKDPNDGFQLECSEMCALNVRKTGGEEFNKGRCTFIRIADELLHIGDLLEDMKGGTPCR